jgi:hypothetical protein
MNTGTGTVIMLHKLNSQIWIPKVIVCIAVTKNIGNSKFIIFKSGVLCVVVDLIFVPCTAVVVSSMIVKFVVLHNIVVSEIKRSI